jgi:hypothetical protein
MRAAAGVVTKTLTALQRLLITLSPNQAMEAASPLEASTSPQPAHDQSSMPPDGRLEAVMQLFCSTLMSTPHMVAHLPSSFRVCAFIAVVHLYDGCVTRVLQA